MRRWHRRIGALVAVIVLLITFTGVLLNHSDDLGLSKHTTDNAFILGMYSIELPEPTAFVVDDQWLSHWGGHYLYLQDREVGYCEPPFAGAVRWRDVLVAICHDEVLMLTPAGEVVERLGEAYDLPSPISGLAVNSGILLVESPAGIFEVDLEQLQWTASERPFKPVVRQHLPSNIATALRDRIAGAEITVERVIADFHSGRILGKWGIWLVDFVAAGLIFLAISGLRLWWFRR